MKSSIFLKLEEVAKRLKASVKTARRRIVSGELRGFKEGGRVCVLEEDLEEYIRRKSERTVTR